MSEGILDTHQHLIYPEKYSYGWTKDVPALAGRAFRYEDYLSATRGCGIGGSIFMETTPDGSHYRDEVKMVEELSRQPGSLICGMIARGEPESPGFEKWLDSLPRPFVVGIRRILHVEADSLSEPPQFADNIRLLGPRKLTFDLCVLARQLSLAAQLVQKCPDVQFVLDHCGVPDIAGGGLDGWRNDLRLLAERPNVACKISGIPAYCISGQATVDAVRPVIEHTIECFGPQRLVWGSDWPVVLVNSSIADWVRMTRQVLAKYDQSTREKILQGNARGIYRPAKAI